MKVGDHIKAPPKGNVYAPDWVDAVVVDVGRHRSIRDPSDGTTQGFQAITVRYDNGGQDQWDLYLLLRRQD